MPEQDIDKPEQVEVEDNEEVSRSDRIAVRVRLTEPEGATVQFVNHMTSQFTAEEFILTFAQVVPPTSAGLTIEEFQQLTHVDAKVVCRIGLSPERMRQLIDILQSNYETYLTQSEDKEDQ